MILNKTTYISIHLEFIHCFSLGEDRIVAIGFQDVLKVSKFQNIFFETPLPKKRMKYLLEKILPNKARAEFCHIFRSFYGQWSFKKNAFEIY
jgi:hypothetical protein